MRHLLVSLAFLFFVGFVHSGGDDARNIVDKGLEAAGGEANLAKFKVQTLEEKGVYYGMGEGLPYTGISTIAYPDKMRMEIKDVFLLVFDGKKGWVREKGQTKEMNDEQRATYLENQRAGWVATLLPLKDKAFTLKTLADVQVKGAPARVVQVTRKGYPEVKLYFDKKSNLLVKFAHRGKSDDMKSKTVLFETYFSDFRDVDGAKHAHKWEMTRDGKQYVESQITAVRAVSKLDPKTFAQPE
jgi:outer membrane lipoprotein-sorting protein